jgi:hypothetical protein
MATTYDTATQRFKTTIVVRPANREWLKQPGVLDKVRTRLDMLSLLPAPPRPRKRVQACIRLTLTQRTALAMHGGADLLDDLIEAITLGEFYD